MEDKSPKYALYARVSTNLQNNENQKQPLINYALSRGYDFTMFEEKESSRKTRPVKQEVIKRLRNREFEGVIVIKLDRWGRSFRELIFELQEFIKKDIKFISLNDNIDFSTSTGRLHFQILASFSEFERSIISERTKAGLNWVKQSGKVLGRPKGSKDRRPRPKRGYILREARKRKFADEASGNILPIEYYLNNRPPKK